MLSLPFVKIVEHSKYRCGIFKLLKSLAPIDCSKIQHCSVNFTKTVPWNFTAKLDITQIRVPFNSTYKATERNSIWDMRWNENKLSPYRLSTYPITHIALPLPLSTCSQCTIALLQFWVRCVPCVWGGGGAVPYNQERISWIRFYVKCWHDTSCHASSHICIYIE